MRQLTVSRDGLGFSISVIFITVNLKTNQVAYSRKCFYLVLDGYEMRPIFLEDILIRLKSSSAMAPYIRARNPTEHFRQKKEDCTAVS
jgi:hypothetical protein